MNRFHIGADWSLFSKLISLKRERERERKNEYFKLNTFQFPELFGQQQLDNQMQQRMEQELIKRTIKINIFETKKINKINKQKKPFRERASCFWAWRITGVPTFIPNFC